MAYLVYNILAVCLFVIALPYLLYRLFREEGFAERFRQSFSFYPKEDIDAVAGKDALWIHAASVGEIVATSAVIKELRKELPEGKILVSVVTATGYKMAKHIIKEADSIIFFPLDLPFLSSRVLKKVKPKVFVNVETELWPNFLCAVKKIGAKAVMINGRISPKSAMRYRYLFVILHNMFSVIEYFCMQSAIDAQHIIALGAAKERVIVTGNTKYDQNYTTLSDEEKKVWLQAFSWQNKKIIVAGSTYEGEEESLFNVLKDIRKDCLDTVLLVAPRSILRAGEIYGLAKKFGFSAACRSEIDLEMGAQLNKQFDVIILDTIGELGQLYGIADIVFVAGSFIRHGGHNILEPAAHGKAILVGPNMQNFQDIYALFKDKEACLTVCDREELKAAISKLLENKDLRNDMGDKALAIVKENRGASQRNVAYIKEILMSFEKEKS